MLLFGFEWVWWFWGGFSGFVLLFGCWWLRCFTEIFGFTWGWYNILPVWMLGFWLRVGALCTGGLDGFSRFERLREHLWVDGSLVLGSVGSDFRWVGGLAANLGFWVLLCLSGGFGIICSSGSVVW